MVYNNFSHIILITILLWTTATSQVRHSRCHKQCKNVCLDSWIQSYLNYECQFKKKKNFFSSDPNQLQQNTQAFVNKDVNKNQRSKYIQKSIKLGSMAAFLYKKTSKILQENQNNYIQKLTFFSCSLNFQFFQSPNKNQESCVVCRRNQSMFLKELRNIKFLTPLIINLKEEFLQQCNQIENNASRQAFYPQLSQINILFLSILFFM